MPELTTVVPPIALPIGTTMGGGPNGHHGAGVPIQLRQRVERQRGVAGRWAVGRIVQDDDGVAELRELAGHGCSSRAAADDDHISLEGLRFVPNGGGHIDLECL